LDLTKKLSIVSNKPLLIIAETKFGAGISFMEGNIDWHYLPLNSEQYQKALIEIEAL
jgi:transketolase